MECCKNQLRVKKMKKGVKRSENEFDSKDDIHVSDLKTSELENVCFRKVVDIFESFPLTTHFPNSDIGAKRYGQNTETMHKGAKNPIFGTATAKIPVIARIWAQTPHCSEKNLVAAPKWGKQRIESLVNPRNEA